MKLLRVLLTDARIAKERLKGCTCRQRAAKYPWDHGTLLETLTEIEARVNDIIALYMEEEKEDGAEKR